MSSSDRKDAALPTHVGIIMDGNGRWATNRNLPRSKGHREGLEAAKRIMNAAAGMGIKYVTLYTSSIRCGFGDSAGKRRHQGL